MVLLDLMDLMELMELMDLMDGAEREEQHYPLTALCSDLVAPFDHTLFIACCTF